METLAQQIIKRYAKLSSARTVWRRLWEDCARYCLPNAAPLRVLGSNTDGNRKKQPLDTVGVEAASKLSSWLYANTIYQGEEWFSLQAPKKEGEHSDIQLEKFLQKAARQALEAIARSNLIKKYQRFLIGYVVFGTDVFYTDFDEDGHIVCREWKITEDIAIAESNTGEIDTVFRKFKYTARQAVQEFGEESLSPDIRKAASNPDEQDKKFTFIHAVYPREKIKKDKNTADNKPWASVYVEVEKQNLVLEGGYDTFPYCVPRFFDTGEVYGRSSAMNALPALRAINIANYFYLKNVEFNTDPMVFVPPNFLDKINIHPGAKNPKDAVDGRVEIWSPSGDMNSPLQFAEKKSEEVKALFFNDAFQYLEDRKNMTATEAQLRYDEMIQGITQILSNLHSEFFEPLIRRVVYGLCEKGIIKVPEAYRREDGKFPDFEVIYTTRLDTKIKGVRNGNILNTYRILGEIDAIRANSPLAQVYLNEEETVKLVCANNNTTADIMNDEDKVAEIKEAQSEQAQQAQLQGLVDKINLQKTPEPGSMQDAMVNGV